MQFWFSGTLDDDLQEIFLRRRIRTLSPNVRTPVSTFSGFNILWISAHQFSRFSLCSWTFLGLAFDHLKKLFLKIFTLFSEIFIYC